jgi:uncharacterized membrane protein YphA (DoxX/SURF4 family)
MVMDTTLTTSGAEKSRRKSITRHLPTVGRILMGLLFTVFGLFGFLTALHIVPEPPSGDMPAAARAFADALGKTGYMVLLSSGTEVVVGLLLLCNRFVPLALILIAPVLVNIFLFHAVLAPSGIGMAIVLGALEIALAWAYRETYRPLFVPRATITG